MSNSLGNIEYITIDSFETKGKYYLSKSGEVKKAGIWFNFKLACNIGSSRSKVLDLLNNVKAKMFEMTNSMNSIHDFSNAIKSEGYKVDLGTYLEDFKASCSKKIFSQKAKRLAEEIADNVSSTIVCDNKETRKELNRILIFSIDDIVNNPPLKKNKDGDQFFDSIEFIKQFSTKASKICDELNSKLEDRLENESLKKGRVLDKLYLDYFEKNFYLASMKKNSVSLDNLKPQKDAFIDSLAAEVNAKLLNDKKKAEQFAPLADHFKSVLETSEGFLKNLIISNSRSILENHNGDLRTLDEVKEKISIIKNNYHDMMKGCSNKLAENFGKNFLKDVGTKKLKDNSINTVIKMINTETPKLLGGLTADASIKEIAKLVENFQLTIDKITNKSGILYDASESAKMSVREFVIGQMLSKLKPEHQEIVNDMVNSVNFSKVYGILSTHVDDLDAEMKEIGRKAPEYNKLFNIKSNEDMLMSLMSMLKLMCFNVLNPDKKFVTDSDYLLHQYDGIDITSKNAKSVLDKSGVNTDVFKNSIFKATMLEV